MSRGCSQLGYGARGASPQGWPPLPLYPTLLKVNPRGAKTTSRCPDPFGAPATWWPEEILQPAIVDKAHVAQNSFIFVLGAGSLQGLWLLNTHFIHLSYCLSPRLIILEAGVTRAKVQKALAVSKKSQLSSHKNRKII